MSYNRQIKKTVFLPGSALEVVLKYQRSYYELDHPETSRFNSEEFLKSVNLQYRVVTHGEIIREEELNRNNVNKHIPYDVEILKSYHDVESLGYGFTQNKKVMKTEYSEQLVVTNITNLKKANLMKEFKKQKYELYENHTVPEFVFFCDSDTRNLTNHNEWKKYPVIICECTGLYLNENDIKAGKYTNHTCLHDLKPIMLENLDKKWIIIHTSTMLKPKDILNVESVLLSEGINVKIVCDIR